MSCTFAARCGDNDFLDGVVAAGRRILGRGSTCGKGDRKRENAGAHIQAAGPFHDSGTSPKKPVAPLAAGILLLGTLLPCLRQP
jgi:hypothetical protein